MKIRTYQMLKTESHHTHPLNLNELHIITADQNFILLCSAVLILEILVYLNSKNATVYLPLNWNFQCAYSLEMTIKLVYILKIAICLLFYFSCHIMVPICRKMKDKKIQIM